MLKKDILKSRKEVDAVIEKLERRLVELRRDRSDLDAAERVLIRLSGKSESSRRHVSLEELAADGGVQPKRTIKSLVFEALMDARQRGEAGLRPRDIRSFIKKHHNRDIGQMANTIPSRLWRETKELNKNKETGLFSLPEQNEPAGDFPSVVPPAGSDLKSRAQGREDDVPGGGT